MKSPIQATAFASLAAVALAGAAQSAEILVTQNISTSTTWTANNTYNLQTQIYVLPGATLTIEAGTVVASTTDLGGSLAIARGAQIFVQGTAANPVIMTSTADVATWVGGDPKTGIWREEANEWGNITIMGRGYISENAVVTNTPAPNPSNVAAMEGLIAAFPGDPNVLYGGGDDNDDSGTLSYLSLRYGGKVIGLNNELNGLSLGGIGRNTDIHHVEIMNNVDDGIEIWGGTVNLKYFSIWNVGDDSLDVDQGWRGKAQFGLIVQGYSLNAAQGSGVGDNLFEVDGAEQSDYQPVTTAGIYNVTVIGQPIAGDHGTAWRDNARVQFRNCVFMDLGERLVSFDNVDGDGGAGYGLNGTLSWANTWTTNANVTSAVNPFPGDPTQYYGAQQPDGKLAEIKDSVFFRNVGPNAYVEATARGVFDAANDNVLIPGIDPFDAPIRMIERGPAVVRGGLTLIQVVGLDPRPVGAATSSVASAPNDGFYTPAMYRGGFEPTDGATWLCDWTASFAYGFTPEAEVGTVYCAGDGSATACPCGNASLVGDGVGCLSSLGFGARLRASGCSSLGNDTLVLSGSQMPNSSVLYFQGTNQAAAGNGTLFGDGLRCAAGQVTRLKQTTNAGNTSHFPAVGDPQISVAGQILAPGLRYYQAWYRNSAAFCTPDGWNLSNGMRITWTP